MTEQRKLLFFCIQKTTRLTRGSGNAMHLNIITPSGTLGMRSGNCISEQKEKLTMSINDINSLAHSKWNCKYHIVFAPKYRRMKNPKVNSILEFAVEFTSIRVFV